MFVKKEFKIVLLLCLFLTTLFVLTLFPYEFSTYWLNKFIGWGRPAVLRALFTPDPTDLVQNILVFLPLGWILFALKEPVQQTRKRWFLLPLAVGFFTSGIIEIIQLFLHRQTSVVDLLANCSGTWFGFFSARRWHWHIRVSNFFQNLFRPFPVRLTAAACYTAGLVYLLLLPPHFSRFSDWNATYPLVLGNEATWDRSWNGNIFTLAVYQKALVQRDAEELNRIKSGPDHVLMRKKKGAVVYYAFMEGKGDTIRDIGCFGLPLNVTSRGLKWQAGGQGLRIGENDSLLSAGPAEKITRSIQADSRFSIEVRFRTRALEQTGPARIVTVSANPDERNFTLGQERDALVFRVRTPVAGLNGSRICLVQKSALQDTLEHHFVVSFDHGLIRMYRDGIPLKPCLRGDISYLPVIMRLGRNTAARLAFCYLFFFPFGLLWSGVFKKGALIWAIISTALLFFGVALVYWLRFSQPFGFAFLFSALFFAGSGSRFAEYFKRAE